MVLQRSADTALDAIIHDISIWTWPTHHRSDQPPDGLLEAGRRELHEILVDLGNSIDALSWSRTQRAHREIS